MKILVPEGGWGGSRSLSICSLNQRHINLQLQGFGTHLVSSLAVSVMQRMMPSLNDHAVFETVNTLPQRQEHGIKAKVRRYPTGLISRKTLWKQQWEKNSKY